MPGACNLWVCSIVDPNKNLIVSSNRLMWSIQPSAYQTVDSVETSIGVVWFHVKEELSCTNICGISNIRSTIRGAFPRHLAICSWTSIESFLKFSRKFDMHFLILSYSIFGKRDIHGKSKAGPDDISRKCVLHYLRLNKCSRHKVFVIESALKCNTIGVVLIGIDRTIKSFICSSSFRIRYSGNGKVVTIRRCIENWRIDFHGYSTRSFNWTK